MRRPILLLTVTALLASACGADEPETLSPLAVEVLSRVDAAVGAQAPLDPDEVVVPEGCELGIETDEYGFETEVVICPDELPTTTTTTPDGTTAPDASTTTTTTTTMPPEPLPLEEWRGSENARSVARRLRQALIEQEGCESSANLVSLENLMAGTPPEVAGPLLAAIQDLRRAATLCNVDLEGWRNATEEAIDDLEAAMAVLEGIDE